MATALCTAYTALKAVAMNRLEAYRGAPCIACGLPATVVVGNTCTNCGARGNGALCNGHAKETVAAAFGDVPRPCAVCQQLALMKWSEPVEIPT